MLVIPKLLNKMEVIREVIVKNIKQIKAHWNKPSPINAKAKQPLEM